MNLFFEKIDTEEKAYILGFVYADGCISKNTFSIKLSIKDEDFLINIKNTLKSEHKIIHTINKNGWGIGNESCSLSIVSKKMVNDLLNDGVFYNKSNILEFPSSSIVPENLLHHFIRGYFDGDGSVYKATYAVGASFEGTKMFLDKLMNVLHEKIGTNSSVQKYKNKEHYCIKIGGANLMKKFYNYLYNDAHIYLDRKKKVFEENLF